jgi:hypothetical protein
MRDGCLGKPEWRSRRSFLEIRSQTKKSDFMHASPNIRHIRLRHLISTISMCLIPSYHPQTVVRPEMVAEKHAIWPSPHNSSSHRLLHTQSPNHNLQATQINPPKHNVTPSLHLSIHKSFRSSPYERHSKPPHRYRSANRDPTHSIVREFTSSDAKPQHSFPLPPESLHF